jgi:hypothetical protein
MIEVKCVCGRVYSALDSSAGKKIKCKGCGTFLVVPLLAPSALLFDQPDDEPADPPEYRAPPADDPAPPTSLFLDIPPPVPATAPPREPWFYRFLESYAWFCIIVGIVQFAIVASLTLASLDWQALSFSSLVPALISLAVLLEITLVSCPILLAVDAARNLRAIRFQPRRP